MLKSANDVPKKSANNARGVAKMFEHANDVEKTKMLKNAKSARGVAKTDYNNNGPAFSGYRLYKRFGFF